jgi:hypothetical protein
LFYPDRDRHSQEITPEKLCIICSGNLPEMFRAADTFVASPRNKSLKHYNALRASDFAFAAELESWGD